MKTAAMLALLAVSFGCDNPPATDNAIASNKPAASAVPTAQAAVAPAAPKADSEKTVVDVAVGSKDHTTLVAALKAGDLVETLGSPGGVYTVFAPTNAAFDKLPKGTVDDLLKPANKDELRRVLQHHAAVPILQLKDMKDGQTLAMADGTKVTLHVKDGKVMVNDAHIVATIPAANGIVHVVDAVLVPPPKT